MNIFNFQMLESIALQGISLLYIKEVNLWNKLEDYLTVKLKSLEYCNNQPHKLTAFK